MIGEDETMDLEVDRVVYCVLVHNARIMLVGVFYVGTYLSNNVVHAYGGRSIYSIKLIH